MKNRKRYYEVLILLLLVLIGVGSAALTTTLNIAGTSGINKNTWDVHFENVSVTNGSVRAVKDATIDSNTTNLSYEIQLDKPGDFYEFTVDIKNSGTIDAMVSEVLKTGLTAEQSNYVSYTLSYIDGTDITVKDKLISSEIEKIIVRVEFKTDITVDQLPNTAQNLNLALNVTYVQANDTASLFRTDSWDQIVANVKAGKTDNYYVGNTKTVDLGSLGTHVLRVANKSTPEECSTDGFSQTACGFVLEFADIITTHVVNSTSTNKGGWPASEMRSYIESAIYPLLPIELKNGIVETKVVSGRGYGDTSNFVSTDKLYLLSTKEVWGTALSFDTLGVETRQLDYYKSMGVTTTNYSGAIKKDGKSNGYWWLRSAYSNYYNRFYDVTSSGGFDDNPVTVSSGVTVAFRIG